MLRRTMSLVIASSLLCCWNQHAEAQVAQGPKMAIYCSWEPYHWQLRPGLAVPGNGATIIANCIVGPGGVGYAWRYFFVPSIPGPLAPVTGPGIGLCTRAGWDFVGQNSGVLFVETHGGWGAFGVVTDDQLNPAGNLNAWKGADVGMVVDVDALRNCRFVDLQNAWYGAGPGAAFKNALTNNNAIVVYAQCHSADVAAAGGRVIDVGGGRVSFGYTGTVFRDEIDSDMQVLFGRLTGKGVAWAGTPVPFDLTEVTQAYSIKNAAGAFAYTDVLHTLWATGKGVRPNDPNTPPGQNPPEDQYYDADKDPYGPGKPEGSPIPVGVPQQEWCKFTLRGAAPTVLRPAVMPPPFPTGPGVPGNVAPVGNNIARNGSGRVNFNASCNGVAGQDASSVITATATLGSFTITDAVWESDSAITFHYETNCQGGFAAELRVLADRVWLKDNPAIHLDGNQNPSSSPNGGVAPNNDDFVWTVSY